MNAALYIPSAALVWLVAILKITYVVRGGRNPGLITLSVALLFLAVTMTVAIPAVWTWLDLSLDAANVSALISQASAIGFALAVHLLVLLWLVPEERVRAAIWWHLLTWALIVGVMTVLFRRIPPLAEEPTNFVVRYAGDPRVATYLAVYVIVFGVVQVSNTLLCWRSAYSDGPGWRRLGLYLVAAASFLGLVYAIIRGIDVLGKQAGLPVHGLEPVARLVICGGVVLASLGCTASSWGARASAAAAWLRDYVSRVRLYHLWTVLYEAVPNIALDPPPRSALHDLLTVRNTGYRITRRVVEINDGFVLLRSRLGPEAWAEAEAYCRGRRLTGPSLQAAVEACLLRRALMIGSPPATQPAPAPPPEHTRMPGELVAAEVRRLRRIARAFSRSRAVRNFPLRESRPV
ncbi:MAB_1171c family putative transporter [Nonomuraea sp. NPDC050404]|uniref:MAB_1171c family putative transporter n=1 Tax=Nonomuraea sp. NPDC050404 TaxID=3155783 RepID=UPI0033D18375